jgi:hypothetical protein
VSLSSIKRVRAAVGQYAEGGGGIERSSATFCVLLAFAYRANTAVGGRPRLQAENARAMAVTPRSVPDALRSPPPAMTPSSRPLAVISAPGGLPRGWRC